MSLHPAIDTAERVYQAEQAEVAGYRQRFLGSITRLHKAGLSTSARQLSQLVEKMATLQLTIARIEYLDRLRCIDWAGGDGVLR